MSDIRAVDRVRGSLFSVEALSALPVDDCNVLLVSGRSLHLLKEFALNEVDFTARYASSFEVAGRYFPVDPDNVFEMDLITDVARNFKLEMTDMTCDITQGLAGIQAAILTTGANACACGTVGETIEAGSGIPGGDPPEGFGEPDPAVTDRLCKAANAIHQSILDTIVALDASPVEGFLNLGFGVVTGLTTAIIAAAFIPIVGLLLVGVAGAVVGVTLALLAGGLSLGGLAADLDDFTDPLVCALTEAVNAQDAIDAYAQVLVDSGQSAVNVALIRAMMTLNVANLLWFSTPDSEAFLDTYVPPFDCATCDETFTHIFDFTIDAQGWVNGAAYGRDFGVYVPGVGWEGEWGVVSLKADERLYLQRIFSSRDITSIEVFYTMTGPDGVESDTDINTLVTNDSITPWACTNCSFEHLYQPLPPDTTTELRTVAVADAPAEFGTDILCYKIVVSGLGSDPF